MIQTGNRNLDDLLSLHRMLISQPPLCTEEYPCKCYKTYDTKEKALSDCLTACNEKPFRHFWDQTEPRLTSKILVHDRSECTCMEDAKTELECVQAGRQFINELFVSVQCTTTKEHANRDVSRTRTFTAPLWVRRRSCRQPMQVW